MKSLIRIIKLCRNYYKQLLLSVGFHVISSFFALFSFVLIAPLLDVIFNKDSAFYEELIANGKPTFDYSSTYFLDYINYILAEAIVSDGPAAALLLVCIFIAISIFGKNLFLYLSTIFVAILVNRSITDFRNNMFHKLITMPVAFLSDEKKGEIISKTTNDVQDIERSIESTINGIFRGTVQIIIFTTTLFLLNLKLSIFIIVFLPIAGITISMIRKSLKKNTTKSQQFFGDMVTHLEETLSGIKLVKAFNSEQRFLQKFKDINESFTGNKIKAFLKSNLASPTSEFLGVAAVIGVLWYGGSLVFDQEIQSSFFITYIVLFSQLINPLKSFSRAVYETQKGNTAVDRIEGMYSEMDSAQLPDGSQSLDHFKTDISFKNVEFTYEVNPILKGISFTVPKGNSVALVGQSGSGKTTIANLLPRFYDVQSGEICIDGVNIKDVKTTDLRSKMGMVTQDSILFNDSVRNNVCFGEDINEEKLVESCKIANAHEFIVQLENGYDTIIGDGGNKLSGGQKQRLSIARAVYKNPDILILDEATSALDTESEKLVQDALNKLMKNRTSIVIAHRLSTIQHADQIIVLQHGEIMEQGKHHELLELNQIYRKLVDMQSFS